MKIAASYLSIKDNLEEKIKILDNTTIDYIHVDVMDGEFVPNKTLDFNSLESILNNTNKPLDVHLMVNDIKSYIDDYSKLNPIFITFHLEATDNLNEMINYIKNLGIKVGLSIKPNTPIESIIPYLKDIDLVLIMSVEPGMGGQQFITNSIDRINYLKEYRSINNLDYVIEVDGGINDETIKLVNSDISVVGSFITKSDNYQEQVNKLKN